MAKKRQGKVYKGKPVREAKYPLEIVVGDNDVKNAKRKNPTQCVIARAVMHDRHVRSARIGRDIALIEFDSHYERYAVNRTTKEMVREFDDNGTFVGGKYKLLPSPKSLRLTGKRHSVITTKQKKDLLRRKALGLRTGGPAGKRVIELPANRNIYRAAKV